MFWTNSCFYRFFRSTVKLEKALPLLACVFKCTHSIFSLIRSFRGVCSQTLSFIVQAGIFIKKRL